MLTYQLIRLSKENACIRGVLLLDYNPVAVTLELPWNQNKRNESCIPAGYYTCRRKIASSGKTGGLPDTFEVVDVKDRDGILFHVGNYPADTQGCILLGTGYSVGPWNVPMVTESKTAFGRFRKSAEGESEINLMIMDILRRGEGPAWTKNNSGTKQGSKRQS